MLAVSVFGDQQHFTYIDVNTGFIWGSWYDGPTDSWNLQQITGPGGRTNGPLTGVLRVSTYKDQQHFAFTQFSSSPEVALGPLLDAWYDGATGNWNLQQITGGGRNGRTTGPSPGYGPLFVSVFLDQQHFVYQEAVGESAVTGATTALVLDSWYDGATNSWNLQQINGGAPNGQTDGPPSVFGSVVVSVFGGQQCILISTESSGTLGTKTERRSQSVGQ